MKKPEELQQQVIRMGVDALHQALDEAKKELERVTIDLDFKELIRTPKEQTAGHRRLIGVLKEEIQQSEAAIKEGQAMLNSYVRAPLPDILPEGWSLDLGGAIR